MIHGAKALRRLHRSGLFWRFLLIGIAVMAPLAGALVQLAGDERKATIEATRKRAELLISYAIDSQNHVIDEAGAVLRFLADAPEVRSGGPTCDAFLKRYLGLQRWMMALRLSNPDGSQVCGDRIEPDAGRRDFLATVLDAKGFVLSNLIANPQTGALSMIAAVPVRQGHRVIGVLSADVNPGIFEGRSPARIDPDLDVHMLVLDRKGTLIAHYPPANKLVGTDLREKPVVRRALEVSQGSIEAPDLFGASRLFVFRGLPGTDAIIAIGLDRLSVIAAI